MKRTSLDFKDMLITGEDKLEKIKKVKASIKLHPNLNCTVQRRKLATGRKAYFNITFYGELAGVNKHRDWTRKMVEAFFPDAHITSACSSTWTFAEY